MDSAEFLDLLGNDNRRRILKLLSQKPCYVTEISEYLGVSPKAVIDHLERLESAGLVESRTDEQRRKYFSISRHVRLEVTVSPYEFGTQSAYPTNSRFDVSTCRRVQLSLDSSVENDGASQPDDETPTEHSVDSSTAGSTRSEPTEEVSTDEVSPNEGSNNETSPNERPNNEVSTNEGPNNEVITNEGRIHEETTNTADEVEPNAVESAQTNLSAGKSSNEDDVAGDVKSLAQQLREFEQLDRELSLVHRWTEGRIAALRKELIEEVPVGDPRLVSELLVELAAEPRETEPLYRRLDAPPEVIEEHLDALATEGLIGRTDRQWHLIG